MAKCPKCDEAISHVHYESHTPSESSGYDGSRSFTAVAFPCGHALAALPVTWETRLDELDVLTRQLDGKLDFIQRELMDIIDLLQVIKKKAF